MAPQQQGGSEGLCIHQKISGFCNWTCLVSKKREKEKRKLWDPELVHVYNKQQKHGDQQDRVLAKLSLKIKYEIKHRKNYYNR